jgi:hypothetical protein
VYNNIKKYSTIYQHLFSILIQIKVDYNLR